MAFSKDQQILALLAAHGSFQADYVAEQERRERMLNGYDYCYSRGINGTPSNGNRNYRVTGSTWDFDYYRDPVTGKAKNAGQRRVRAITPVTVYNAPQVAETPHRITCADRPAIQADFD